MKAVLRQALAESGTTAKAIAQACERRHGYILDALNDNEPQELTVRDLVTFMRATSVTPLKHLCREFDGTFVPLPVFPAGHADIRDRFLVAIEEVGRDSAAIQRALLDGEISDNEGRDVVAELEDTIAVFREVIALVQARRQRPARMTLPTSTAKAVSA